LIDRTVHQVWQMTRWCCLLMLNNSRRISSRNSLTITSVVSTSGTLSYLQVYSGTCNISPGTSDVSSTQSLKYKYPSLKYKYKYPDCKYKYKYKCL